MNVVNKSREKVVYIIVIALFVVGLLGSYPINANELAINEAGRYDFSAQTIQGEAFEYQNSKAEKPLVIVGGGGWHVALSRALK